MLRSQILSDLASSASFCKAFENLSIGDIGAAAGVAVGTLTTFTAVFNASGCESTGLSFAPEYARLGIRYETLLDEPTGMTLADCGTCFSLKQIAERMVRGEDVQPRQTVVVGRDGSIIRVHSTRTCTDTATIHFFYEANRKLRALARAPGARVLVHCTAGVNRSASAIVAYAMLSRGVPFESAAGQVISSALKKRQVRPLTNARFCDILRRVFEPARQRSLISSGADDGETASRDAYLAEHAVILSTAMELARQPAGVSTDLIGCEAMSPSDVCRSLPRLVAAVRQIIGRRNASVCRFCGAAGPELLLYCKEDKSCYCSAECQVMWARLANRMGFF